ncbi:polysaccharide deacetylase family protein [Aquamicrobium lusatiense]|uniref:polysaccharide deacetylase family protein n=1 Tax=Aquamicrobium lusatiense TaxID=89772 RepID=UPI0024540A19|nr:polysaccharide deacetylase family protein [Aquamicrobium lusatiense]MDH4991213.1 polysaccharide deacetylase family protein [Aquamicrobium lusatiense]
MTMKTTLRRAIRNAAIRAGLEAVALTNAGAVWSQAAGRGVIFTLHHVRPHQGQAFDPNALLSVTPEFLDAAIETCLGTGMVPVALEDLPQLLADPDDRRRFVCFTLDDGYRNNAQYAAPVFRRHGVPYTIFLCRGFVERTRSLWWETAGTLIRRTNELTFDFGGGSESLPLNTVARKQAAFDRLSSFIQAEDEDETIARLDAEAIRHGIEPLAIVDDLVMGADEIRELARDPLACFGAHTLTHVNLRRVDAARLASEIEGSIRAVEEWTGKRPSSFAYPYGFAAAAGEREFSAVREAGLSIAVTTRPGVLGAGSLGQPTALPRVSLNGLYQKPRYVKALASGIPFRLM